MSGAFPGAGNIGALWQQLLAGKELISFLPGETDGGSCPGIGHFVPAIACVDGIEYFDADFFGITPSEAELTDPQHRILLEHCWSALEHAGYSPRTCSVPVGVFAGATTNTYLVHNIASRRDLICAVDPIQLNIGNGADFITTRISYKLNLCGPSHAVQSACSTSLVAVHCGCSSLANLECDMALAGGVSINVNLLRGYRYLPDGILSPDGHCRPFDRQARGTVFGSGVGVVVLKRLEDALRDGDTIHAVIRGSAVNNDGAAKASFTAPSVEGQVRVISDALFSSGVPSNSITYIECHGTGTLLGDAIEVRALKKAFRGGEPGSCALGSVKGNVGHLDAAAGITGLIKVVLSLKHKMLPPSLHYHETNPQIDFTDSPFYVNTELRPWENRGGPLRAGVSAFGVGGTNAHVLLEEAPEMETLDEGRPWQLLLLSARSQTALQQMEENLATHLQQHPEQLLADVVYTLQVGRQRFDQRRSLVCQNRQEAIEILRRCDRQCSGGEDAPTVVFLFPGQGSQYEEMGRELYEREDVFRRYLDQCWEILQPHLGIHLNEMWALAKDPQRSEIDQTWLAQPVLVAIEYALSQLWMSWGVRPEAMAGHSLGEYTAACLAGVMTLEDGLSLVAARGRIMQQCGAGGMLAVTLSADAVQQQLEGELGVAAINAPDLCVVSGPVEQIKQLQQRLQNEGLSCQRLRTSHAYHCGLVEPAMSLFLAELQKVRLRAPLIPIISSVTGTWMKAEEAMDANFWVRQMRLPVRFDVVLQQILSDSQRFLLEVGPGRHLVRLARRNAEADKTLKLASSMPGKQRGHSSEVETMLQALGQLWEAGVPIDWKGFHGPASKRRRVPLPTYPFERKRHWIDPAPLPGVAQRDAELGLTPSPSKAPEAASFPENTRPILRNSYVPARSHAEHVIVGILERALGIRPIGVTDKFAELGGDSLVAIRIITEINISLNCNLRAIDMYEDLTARDIANHLTSTFTDTSPEVSGQPIDLARRSAYRLKNRNEQKLSTTTE
jgi:acyl transferase domain-containing protein